MALLKEYLRRELKTLLDNDIVFRVVGRMDGLDSSVQRELERALDATAHCKGMVFNIALNYSGRAELADAMRALAAEGEGRRACARGHRRGRDRIASSTRPGCPTRTS